FAKLSTRFVADSGSSKKRLNGARQVWSAMGLEAETRRFVPLFTELRRQLEALRLQTGDSIGLIATKCSPNTTYVAIRQMISKAGVPLWERLIPFNPAGVPASGILTTPSRFNGKTTSRHTLFLVVKTIRRHTSPLIAFSKSDSSKCK
ncbi:MAG: hypothetical protein IJE77_13515, partial [Thermoguttaceae bacterium]|nr:hypothetical protein [Thermoguttaceae bacterium]